MLARSLRLPAQDVPATARAGRKFLGQYFDVRFKARTSEQTEARISPVRCAFVISTKVSKLATERNRMRRVLRAAAFGAVTSQRLPAGDYVFIVKSKELLKFNAPAVESMLVALCARENTNPL